MALLDDFQDEIQTKTDKTDKLPLEQEKLVEETLVDAQDDNTPEQDTAEVFDGVVDLTATRKKRFHINRGTGVGGVLELNTSDMNVITRLEQLYPRLQKLSQEASTKQLLTEAGDEKSLTKLSQALSTIDSQMRQIVDDIFDSNVSEVCAPDGSMFDPFNGEFRYEHIIEVLPRVVYYPKYFHN